MYRSLVGDSLCVFYNRQKVIYVYLDIFLIIELFEGICYAKMD